MVIFTEQYGAGKPNAPSNAAMPAWVCDQCSKVVFVRAEHQPGVVRKSARDARATARRTLMKSVFVKHRADRALQKSLSRKRRSKDPNKT